jgi:hypothetical protein
VLLLTGKPGSGKSALAAWLAGAGGQPGNAEARSRLERVRNAWQAAHFCIADQHHGSVNPIRFAQSLARQLADRHERFARAALQRIAPEINVDQGAGEVWGTMIGVQIDTLVLNATAEDVWNRAVREPLEQLAAELPGLRISILVDALDEAMTFPPPNIVTLLAGSDDFPPGVRFLCTSRNDARVIEQFKNVRRLNLAAARWAPESDRDIAAYLRRRLLDDPAVAQRLGQTDTATLTDRLMRQAAGNFLYVRFLLDDVAEGHRTLADLRSLPTGLYGLYRTYLDRIFPGMLAVGGDERWLHFQSLLGCLSVAVPAAPRHLLPGWLGQDDGEVAIRLGQVTQLTDRIPLPDPEDDRPRYGYRLYHRSMAEFLATDTYLENEDVIENRYFTAPRDQHERIARYYTENYHGHWSKCDRYGLRQIVGHLAARLRLEEATPAAHQAAAERLYEVVLDHSFRAAQLAKLGDVSATLADLRTAIDAALGQDDLVNTLACIGAYRRTVRMGSTPQAILASLLELPLPTPTVAQAVFAAVDIGDMAEARRRAGFYSATPDWGRVVHLYLAWEAAERGDAVAARAAAAAAHPMPLSQALELCDGLLVRTARALAAIGAEGADARGWLAEFQRGEDADSLLASFPPAVQPQPPVRDQTLAQVNDQLSQLEQAWTVGDDPEAVEMQPFIDRERTGEQMRSLQQALRIVAADPLGQASIDRALTVIIPNAYTRYRDLALIAVGVACLAVEDPQWVRYRLRRLLHTALASEGITFTFDLPAILKGELEGRGLAVPLELSEYVEQGLATDDIWGTAMRAYSARAVALSRQGRTDEAFDTLQFAASKRPGFVGFATTTLLALADRCMDLGQGIRAAQPIWSVQIRANLPAIRSAFPTEQQAVLDELIDHLKELRADPRFGLGQPLIMPISREQDKSLLEAAAAAAANVRDPEFRHERMALVLSYIRSWLEPLPHPAQAQVALADLADRDTRLAYINQVSARWSQAAHQTTWDDLKALVPLALADGTTLDAVLGRLVSARLSQLGELELTEAMKICTVDHTTGRPWELWPPPLE